MEGISVVICCYNSKDRLFETLQCLFNQVVNVLLNWEVIVVDNNSNDDTYNEAIKFEQELNRNNISFKIVSESKAGLQYAREKGISVSKYDYVLFCDDDNRLFPDYLQISYNILKDNKDIGILGGEGMPDPEVLLPDWFNPFRNYYATGRFKEKSGEQKAVYGAGMILKKELFLKLLNSDFSFFLSGRTDNKMLAGDDTELCFIYRYFGYVIYFDERLRFNHFIPQKRLSLDYLKKAQMGFGRSQAYFTLYKYFLNGQEFSLSVYFKQVVNLLIYIFHPKNVYLFVFLKKNKPVFNYRYKMKFYHLAEWLSFYFRLKKIRINFENLFLLKKDYFSKVKSN